VEDGGVGGWGGLGGVSIGRGGMWEEGSEVVCRGAIAPSRSKRCLIRVAYGDWSSEAMRAVHPLISAAKPSPFAAPAGPRHPGYLDCVHDADGELLGGHELLGQVALAVTEVMGSFKEIAGGFIRV
jgi:hypothetical protein